MESKPKENPYKLKNYSDESWVVEIFNELHQVSPSELNSKNSRSFCICQVPESLSSGKLEAFVPKFVGLGPYHHFHEKLTLTAQLKLTAAKRVLKDQLPNNKEAFKQLVTKYCTDIKDLYNVDVKSSYTDETLSYLLTVDGLFLLAFLLNTEGFSYFLTGIPGMPLFNAAGVELTKNALIREIFMLENQIPIHVLKQIIGVKGNSIPPIELSLGSVLQNFCIEHRPLVNSKELPKDPEKCDHLLDLMYQLMIVHEPPPKENQQDQRGTTTDSPSEDVNNNLKSINTDQEIHHEDKDNTWCSLCYDILIFPVLFMCFIVKLIYEFGRLLGSLCRELFKALGGLYRLLKILASLINPVFSAIHRTLTEYEANYPSVKRYTKLFDFLEKATSTGEQGQGSKDQDSDDVGPVVMIHSVTELHRAGITFQPAQGGISSIDFDEVNCVFYLPCIKLDVNSEFIIRNLVAYESLTKPNSLKFTRYVELMKAIVDTPEDVKLLVKGQIIQSEFRHDAVTDLFNGMGKSIRKNTKTPELDRVIKKVNAKFDSTEKQKRLVTKLTSAKVISTIGGLVFLVLTAAQTYCSARNCSRISP